MSSATINIKFLADLKQFSSQLQNSSRKIKKMGRELQSVGTALSVGVTAPFVAFSVKAVKAWDVQAKAIAQVEAGLRSTGGAVGYTSSELQKMASELQNNTLFGDEEILKGVTSQLLTFTNIAGQQFGRTQQAALDLATRLDGDLKSASISLGKALNDPIANLSALSRSGIQFSDSQQAMIKSLVETNRLADAQTLILDELEKQFGGSAEAAAKAGLGPFKQLSNAIGDLSEEFGKIISEAISPFVGALKVVVSGFQSLSPQVKKFILIIGGVAAAIGPFLALAGTILPSILTGFTLLASPITAVVAALAAVGVVIYKNWEPIKQTLVDIGNYFVDLYNESLAFRIAVQGVVLMFKNLWSVASFVLSSIKDVFTGLIKSFVSRFKLVGAIFKAVLTNPLKDISEAVKKAVANYVSDSQKGMSEVGNNIKANWKDLMVDVTANTKQALADVGKRTKIVFGKDNVDTKAITDKVEEISLVKVPVKLTTGNGGGKRKKAVALEGLSFDQKIDSSFLDSFRKLPEVVAASTTLASEHISEFQGRLGEFNAAASQILEQVSESFISGFAETIGAIAAGTENGSALMALALSSIASMLIQLGKLAIQTGIAIAGIKTALESINPFVAIAAGIALVALGSLVRSRARNIGESGGSSPRPFANGGIVYGPTNALIGEYAGARSNPEVVAPLNKLRDLISPSSQAVNVTVGGSFQLQGRMLRLVLDDYDLRKSRTS